METKLKTHYRNIWVNFSLLNLCTVAFLGFVLRSKMIFDLPFVDFNHLSDAHGHFAFGAWVGFTLAYLLVSVLLPANESVKRKYWWLIALLGLFSWTIMISYIIEGNSNITKLFSVLYIITTFIFSTLFILKINKTNIQWQVKLLAISSLICLVLSAVGPIALVYLFSVKSLNAIFYRDALFTYLHLQYNGFFTLAVFALLFFKLLPIVPTAGKKKINYFSILLVLSIIPSLFLSYLWHDPQIFFKIMAIAGSILVFLTFLWFVLWAFATRKLFSGISSVVKLLGILSMIAFAIKEFLQGFMIFPGILDAVFGSRPTILGFLHLVFLGVVTIFILGWFVQKGMLNGGKIFTRVAFFIFITGIIANETVLMIQGLGGMFIISYAIIPWALWYVSIWLLTGALLLFIARIQSNRSENRANSVLSGANKLP